MAFAGNQEDISIKISLGIEAIERKEKCKRESRKKEN
jgi:hypothetical protein